MVLLVRHADSGSRKHWDGDDDQGPLSGTCHEQARHVAALLTLLGPDQVVSAPPVRSRETVAPLAAALRLAVIDDPVPGKDGCCRIGTAGGRAPQFGARRPTMIIV